MEVVVGRVSVCERREKMSKTNENPEKGIESQIRNERKRRTKSREKLSRTRETSLLNASLIGLVDSTSTPVRGMESIKAHGPKPMLIVYG
jgi:hypothetical protein